LGGHQGTEFARYAPIVKISRATLFSANDEGRMMNDENRRAGFVS
jgi:hypothetical protein